MFGVGFPYHVGSDEQWLAVLAGYVVYLSLPVEFQFYPSLFDILDAV